MGKMISINPESQSSQENYKLLIGSIIPRPIAFVTSLSEEGVLNAAPFSFFNIIASDPPMVSISVQRKQGVQKDTARNAAAKGAFVVHIVDENNVSAINETAANVGSDVSEVELARLTPIASEAIEVPGISEANIRMECVLEHMLPLGGGEGTAACDMLIGRIVRFHVADDLYHEGRIDPIGLKPVARLAGNDYSTLGELFTIERPL